MTVIYGNFIYPVTKDKIVFKKNSYLFLENGKVKKMSDEKPHNEEITDYSKYLIIPSFYDIHLHAPQYPNLGVGYDLQLLEWLDRYTFKEESRYDNENYAKQVYKRFVNDLWYNGILYASVFGTIHKNSDILLAELMEKAGIRGYVGKVNMDRNAPEELTETTEDSLKDTVDFIREMKRFSKVKPIITPRFVPSTTSKLMKGLGETAKKYSVPVQSHLSENKDEISWVKELHPECKNYGSVYDKYGLFGQQKTVMAHCIHSDEDERALLKERDVFIAHCPTSNFNVSSGLCPAKFYIDEDMNIGVGSDIAGGHTLNMFEVMRNIFSAANIRYAYGMSEPLTLENVMYMTFYNSGKFFENPGTFEEGSDFNALIIDDSELMDEKDSLRERLVKLIYEGDGSRIKIRYSKGQQIKNPNL